MNIINELQNYSSIIMLFSFIFGLLIGSFLNVVIYRLPIIMKNAWQAECAEFLNQPQPKTKSFNLVTPRSHCPNCKAPITAISNIPLLSFIFQQGKCRHCKNKITWRCPLVELLGGIVTVFIVHTFGLTFQAAFILILSYALIAAIFIDLQHQLLPDDIVLSMLWLGLLANAYYVFTTPQNAIIGAASAYCSLWLVASIFKLVRKVDGMGHGDFKLFAVFGAWFGWKLLPLIILFAAFAGAIVGVTMILLKKHKLQHPMPFGPYIAIAGWLSIFWGEKVFCWYVTSILNFKF